MDLNESDFKIDGSAFFFDNLLLLLLFIKCQFRPGGHEMMKMLVVTNLI